MNELVKLKTGSASLWGLPIALGILGCAIVAFAACSDSGASTSNVASVCIDCTGSNTNPLTGPCSFEKTDVNGYCDCHKGANCDKTGTTYPNHIVTTYFGGSCGVGGCAGYTNSTTTNATVTEWSSKVCGSGS